jgi:hypothetical protein
LLDTVYRETNGHRRWAVGQPPGLADALLAVLEEVLDRIARALDVGDEGDHGAGVSGVFGVPGVSGVSGVSGLPRSGVGSVPGSGWVMPPWGGGSSRSWALATPPRLRAASTTEMARIRASYNAVMGTVLLSCQ